MDTHILDFNMQPDTEIILEKKELHNHIDHMFFENVKSLSLGISLLFFLFTIGNLFHKAWIDRPLMLVISGSTFIISLAILLVLYKIKMPYWYAHPLATFLMLIMLFNSVFHANYTQEPLYLANIYFVILGAGVFFLSFRWYYLTLVASILTFIFCGNFFNLSDYETSMRIALYLMAAISILINYVRITSNRKFHRLYLITQIQKKHFEELLPIVRDSEMKYHTIFEISPEAIVLTDAEGMIIDMNNRSNDWLGYSSEEIKGKTFQDLPFIDDEHKALIKKQFEQHINGESPEPYEMEFISRNGLKRTGLILASPIKNVDGTIVGQLVVIPDITDRMQAETRQKRLLTDLENANKELKEFAYVVSHDLKAPLRAINALATWISADYADKFDAEGKEQMALLISRANRMHNLIDGILQYSRVGRIQEEKVTINLNQVIPEIIDALAPPSHITCTMVSTMPTIHFESTRINQVFQNLLSNAIKFNDKAEGKIELGCQDYGDHWEFFVRDNGPGIPENSYKNIFKIFQTLQSKDEYESTGIGLTSVKKIITLYGGTIWVESKLGEETTFRFTIKKEN